MVAHAFVEGAGPRGEGVSGGEGLLDSAHFNTSRGDAQCGACKSCFRQFPSGLGMSRAAPGHCLHSPPVDTAKLEAVATHSTNIRSCSC